MFVLMVKGLKYLPPEERQSRTIAHTRESVTSLSVVIVRRDQQVNATRRDIKELMIPQ